MRGIVLGLFLTLAPNSTLWTDSLPPERYAVEGFATVAFLTPDNVAKACGLTAPEGMRVVACTKRYEGRALVIMPLPNEAGKSEYYAQLMAHELGHLNGWPATHGE